MHRPQEYFLPCIPLFPHSRPPCFSFQRSSFCLTPLCPVSKAQRHRVGRVEMTWRSKKREQEDSMKRKLGRISSNHFCSIILLLSLRLGGWVDKPATHLCRRWGSDSELVPNTQTLHFLNLLSHCRLESRWVGIHKAIFCSPFAFFLFQTT